jgi:hypothetical protein
LRHHLILWWKWWSLLHRESHLRRLVHRMLWREIRWYTIWSRPLNRSLERLRLHKWSLLLGRVRILMLWQLRLLLVHHNRITLLKWSLLEILLRIKRHLWRYLVNRWLLLKLIIINIILLICFLIWFFNIYICFINYLLRFRLLRLKFNFIFLFKKIFKKSF